MMEMLRNCFKQIIIRDLDETNFCHFEPFLTISNHSNSLYYLKNLTICLDENL